MDLIPTEQLIRSLFRRWPDCVVLGQKQSRRPSTNGEGEVMHYRRRTGNPFTLLGLLMMEVQGTQRDILAETREVNEE